MPATPSQPIQFYSFPLSGNSHRVHLLLSILDLPYQTINVDLRNAEQKTPKFLALNPFGQVPVIRDGEVIISESLAILTYLSEKYGSDQWRPRNPREAAEIQRWFSLAAGPLASGPASARLAVLFGAPIDLPAAQERSRNFLSVVDAFLSSAPFLAGERLSLADLAHYAYIARAPEGGITLDPYPHIEAWLRRVEASPRFVPMPKAV